MVTKAINGKKSLSRATVADRILNQTHYRRPVLSGIIRARSTRGRKEGQKKGFHLDLICFRDKVSFCSRVCWPFWARTTCRGNKQDSDEDFFLPWGLMGPAHAHIMSDKTWRRYGKPIWPLLPLSAPHPMVIGDGIFGGMNIGGWNFAFNPPEGHHGGYGISGY